MSEQQGAPPSIEQMISDNRAQENAFNAQLNQSQVDKFMEGVQSPSIEQRIADARSQEQAFNYKNAKAINDQIVDALVMEGAPPEKFALPFEHDRHESVGRNEPLLRNYLSEGAFPVEIGNHIISTINDTAKAHASMTEVEQELWGRSQLKVLEDIWGKDAQRKIDIAVNFGIELEAKHPGFAELMETTRAGDSAELVAHFYLQAERQKSKGKK